MGMPGFPDVCCPVLDPDVHVAADGLECWLGSLVNQVNWQAGTVWVCRVEMLHRHCFAILWLFLQNTKIVSSNIQTCSTYEISQQMNF